MIICPLENVLLFGKCNVTTCMWYKGTGNCGHGSVEPSCASTDLDALGDGSLDETKTRIMWYVTVGTFLEAYSNKELVNLTESDFPDRKVFLEWCKGRSVKSYATIPYNRIVGHIKKEL